MSGAAASRWGSTGSRTGSGEAGILYLALLFSVVLIGIVTAVAAPLWRTMVQREKEAELLFRLGEFRRAITAYQAVHKRFPQKLEDLLLLKDLAEAGKVMPVIDRTYPLEQAAEAHAYVETGEKKGSVVISLEHLH